MHIPLRNDPDARCTCNHPRIAHQIFRAGHPCTECGCKRWREFTHAATGYEKGCRCETCKAGHAAKVQAYRRERMARTGEVMRNGRFVSIPQPRDGRDA